MCDSLIQNRQKVSVKSAYIYALPHQVKSAILQTESIFR